MGQLLLTSFLLRSPSQFLTSAGTPVARVALKSSLRSLLFSHQPSWRAAHREGVYTAPGHCSVNWVRSVGTRGRDEAGQAGPRAAGNMCPLLLDLQSPGDEASRDILLEANDQSLQSPSLIRNKALLVRHSARGLTASPQAMHAQGNTALEGRDTE